jgi:hypothetical protein
MTCIIEHQVQLPKAVTIRAKEVPEAQDRRLPGRDLFSRLCETGFLCGDFHDAAGLGDVGD